MAWVYILQSRKNGSYYVGSTNDLQRRIIEHNSGHTTYTREILPVSLIFQQEYPDLLTARRIELWIKKQKNSSFIQRIITEGRITKNL